MALQIRKAEKKQSRLRLSLAGPAGSGKTYSALKIASEIGGKILVVDTERGSSEKYADEFDFDVIQLQDFHPDNFIEAIRLAESSGYQIIVLDSTSHEWNGKNGILELHEATVAKQRTKNSYTAWAEVTPLHTKFIDSILQCKAHVIATVRSKTDYVQDKDENGKSRVTKVGMAAIQRDGMDYEYDIALEISVDHVGIVTKTRCAKLDGKVFKKPGAEFAEIVKEWLGSGAPIPELSKEEIAEQVNILTEIKGLWIEYGNASAKFDIYRDDKLAGVTTAELKVVLAKWNDVVSKKRAEAQSEQENLAMAANSAAAELERMADGIVNKTETFTA